jgi:hypothetical protein
VAELTRSERFDERSVAHIANSDLTPSTRFHLDRYELANSLVCSLIGIARLLVGAAR